MKKIKIKDSRKEIGTYKTRAFKVRLGSIESRSGHFAIGNIKEVIDFDEEDFDEWAESTSGSPITSLVRDNMFILFNNYVLDSEYDVYAYMVEMGDGWVMEKVEIIAGMVNGFKSEKVKEEKNLLDLLEI